MTGASLKSLIENTLQIPCYVGATSIVYPSVVLEVGLISTSLHGDGKRVAETHTAYIDIYATSASSRDSYLASLVAVLDNQFSVTMSDRETYYDTTAKKYRAHFSLDFIYKEES